MSNAFLQRRAHALRACSTPSLSPGCILITLNCEVIIIITPFLSRVTEVGALGGVVNEIAERLPGRLHVRRPVVIELVGAVLQRLAGHAHRDN